jgi:hypothetical protein
MKMVRRQKTARRRLVPQEVYEARVAALGVASQSAMARKLGVAQSTLTRAVNGDTYRDVPFPLEVEWDFGPGAREFYPYEVAVEMLRDAAPGEVEVVEEPWRPRVSLGQILVMARMLPQPDLETRKRQWRAEMEEALVGEDAYKVRR